LINSIYLADIEKVDRDRRWQKIAGNRNHHSQLCSDT